MADIEKWSGPKEATEKIQKICDEAKTQAEEQTKKKYDEFKAVEYIEWHHLIGGGTNYIIKVNVGSEGYVHLSVHTNHSIYPPVFKLLSVQQHKTKEDPLVPFSV